MAGLPDYRCVAFADSIGTMFRSVTRVRESRGLDPPDGADVIDDDRFHYLRHLPVISLGAGVCSLSFRNKIKVYVAGKKGIYQKNSAWYGWFNGRHLVDDG